MSKTAWKYSISVLITIIFIETISWAFLNLYIHLSKKVSNDVKLIEYWEFDPYLIWIPKKNTEGYDKYSRFKMNNYGFRNDYDIDQKKPNNVFRVIVLGGSVAWGTGASSNRTVWTKVLEDLMEGALGRKVEVLNAGCAGYVSFQELVYLEFRLLQFSPDLVIVFDGYNDLYRSSLYSDNEYQDNVIPNYVIEKSFFDSPLIIQIIGLIKEKSYFFKLTKRIYEKIIYESGRPIYNVKYLNKRGIANYLNNIKSISDILKGRGIKSIFLLQPYLAESGKPLSSEERKVLSNAGQEVAVIKKAMDILRGEYKSFSSKNDLVFYDLNDVFDSFSVNQTFWYDHVHLNDEGHRVIGEKVKEIAIKYFP